MSHFKHYGFFVGDISEERISFCATVDDDECPQGWGELLDRLGSFLDAPFSGSCYDPLPSKEWGQQGASFDDFWDWLISEGETGNLDGIASTRDKARDQLLTWIETKFDTNLVPCENDCPEVTLVFSQDDFNKYKGLYADYASSEEGSLSEDE